MIKFFVTWGAIFAVLAVVLCTFNLSVAAAVAFVNWEPFTFGPAELYRFWIAVAFGLSFVISVIVSVDD